MVFKGWGYKINFLYYRHAFFLFLHIEMFSATEIFDWNMFYNIRLFNISVNEDLSFVIQYWYINVCSIRISKLSVNVDLPFVIQSILVVDWFQWNLSYPVLSAATMTSRTESAREHETELWQPQTWTPPAGNRRQ